MHSDTLIFIDLFALLSAAVIFVPLFHFLGLGSILGYLAAGMLLGPSILGIIDNVDEIRHFAEFGVIFLLFLIGIEMKPERLFVMRRWVFGLGSAQILITSGILTLIAYFLQLPLRSSIIVGMGLALSSTAFGMQILAEKGELTSVNGRTAFSVLLMQDLAVVPLLGMVSLMAGGAELTESISDAFVQAILAIAIVVISGRYLLNPFLDKIAASRNSEVFIAAVVLLVLGISKLMETVGLSMALGAFLAGVMLAESHYRHQITADILPFRGILLGLFFMTVGMSIKLELLLHNAWLLFTLVAILLLVKSAVLWSLCKVSKLNNITSLKVALLLSQGGEFGFVLFGYAMIYGVLIEERVQLISLVITLSMIVTPLLVKLGDYLSASIQTRLPPGIPPQNMVIEKKHHIIIAGFGRVGMRIATILQNAEISYIALDYRQEIVAKGKLDGYPVYYGDANKLSILKAAGAEQASMLIIAIDNREHAEHLVEIAHQHYPLLPIHARGNSRTHCEALLQKGAKNTVSETLEASMRLAELALLDSGIGVQQASVLLDDYRHGYYERLKVKSTHDLSQNNH
jgi:K+:H+ antiporter